MSVTQDNRLIDLIPSELVNLKEVYERRFIRRKDAFDEKQREVLKALEPLIAAHRKAVHSYEDHFDEGLLSYGRDPNKMPLDERDVKEVKKARALKRQVEDAEYVARQKEAEIMKELRAMPECQSLIEAQTEYENWLAKICQFLKCCPADLDWKERKIARVSTQSCSLPTELLALPNE